MEESLVLNTYSTILKVDNLDCLDIAKEVFSMACKLSVKKPLLMDIKFFLVKLYYKKELRRDFKSYIFKI